MATTKHCFDTIVFLANFVGRCRRDGESAASAVARVMYQYDVNLQMAVQSEIERRDRD